MDPVPSNFKLLVPVAKDIISQTIDWEAEERRQKEEFLLKRGDLKQIEQYRKYVGLSSGPTNIEEFKNVFDCLGVATQYEKHQLEMDPAPSEKDYVESPAKDISNSEVDIIMNPPRTPAAELMWPLVQEMYDYAQLRTYNVPESLRTHFEFWQKKDFLYPEDNIDIQKAKSASKKAGLVALNQAFEEIRATNRKQLRILAFGCGNGLSDIQRIITANGSSRNIHVDMWDPYVPLDPNARKLTNRAVIPGKDFPNTEHPNFPESYYDIIFSMNSLHYNAKPVGGKYTMLERVLKALAPNGAICGLYPSSHGIATCCRFNDRYSDWPNPSNIELLAYEFNNDGVLMMQTRIFGKEYDEPVLEPSILQALFLKFGFVGQVFNAADAPKILKHKSTAQIKRIDEYPEVGAFNVFYARRLADRPLDSHISDMKSSDPYTIRLIDGTDYRDYVEYYPSHVLNSGRPIKGPDKWRFVNGGAWLFSEKTDGYSANCRNVGGNLYIFSPGRKTAVIATGDYTDLSFQAELVLKGEYYELVFIQLNSYNNQTYAFGPGLLLAHTIRAHSFFKHIHFKKWTTNAIDLTKDENNEGIVIMSFCAGPPHTLQANGGPCERLLGNARYVKRRWTIDLEFYTDKREIYVEGVKYVLPQEYTMPCVAEFELTGSFIKLRRDKHRGNTQLQIEDLHKAINWSPFVRFVLKSYYIKWKPMSAAFNFITKPCQDWTAEEILVMAISYPKGFICIEDPDVRKEVYKIRKDVYDSGILSAYANSQAKGINVELSRYDCYF